jgi:hypothetical protein
MGTLPVPPTLTARKRAMNACMVSFYTVRRFSASQFNGRRRTR